MKTEEIIENIKRNKKIGIVIISALFYIIAYKVTNSNMLLALNSVLILIGVLLYSKYATMSLLVTTIGYLCEALVINNGVDIREVIFKSIVIPVIGIIMAPIFKFRLIREGSIKETIKRTIKQEDKARKTSIIFKLVVISLTVSLAMSASEYMNNTLVVGFWLILPLISQLMIVVRADMYYIMLLIQQVVTMVILYMQYRVGGIDIVNTIAVLLLTVVIIYSLQEYIRINKENQ